MEETAFLRGIPIEILEHTKENSTLLYDFLTLLPYQQYQVEDAYSYSPGEYLSAWFANYIHRITSYPEKKVSEESIDIFLDPEGEELALLVSDFPVSAETLKRLDEYIQKKSLPLVAENIIGLSHKRARELLYTGYLTPLFSEKDYLEKKNLISETTTQRMMEISATNKEALVYAQNWDGKDKSFLALNVPKTIYDMPGGVLSKILGYSIDPSDIGIIAATTKRWNKSEIEWDVIDVASLKSHDLKKIINKSIKTRIKELYLSNKRLSDEEIVLISTLPNLEVLSLKNVDLRRDVFKILGDLTSLKKLFIERSKFYFNFLSSFKNPRSIEELSINSSSYFSGTINDIDKLYLIKDFVNLKRLSINSYKYNTNKIDISPVFDLKYLEYLSVGIYDDTVLRGIEKIPLIELKLDFVDYDDDKFFDTSDIGLCKTLERLEILLNITDEGVENLADLDLKSLNISCAFLSQAGIDIIGESFPNLEELDLSGFIGTLDLISLGGKIKLRNLKLYDVDEVVNITSPNLKSLDIVTQELGDYMINEIKVHSTLEELKLSGSYLMNLPGIQMFKELRKLDLGSSIGIRNHAIGTISELKNLEYLNISGCINITDNSFNYLKKMSSLIELDLPPIFTGEQLLELEMAIPGIDITVRDEYMPYEPEERDELFLPQDELEYEEY